MKFSIGLAIVALTTFTAGSAFATQQANPQADNAFGTVVTVPALKASHTRRLSTSATGKASLANCSNTQTGPPATTPTSSAKYRPWAPRPRRFC